MGAARNLDIDVDQFSTLSRMIRGKTGLNFKLTDKNRRMLRTKLIPLLNKHNIESFPKLVQLSQKFDADSPILKDLISAVTVNVTQFFREQEHFKFLFDKPATSQINFNQELRIWCAACSTGQEAYSLAMSIEENWKDVNYRLLATDIDRSALKEAAQGMYSTDELKNTPPELVQRYFDKETQGMLIKESLAKKVQFAPLNLCDHHYPFKSKFHIIFCRNVFIYFEVEQVQRIVSNLVRHLAPGGLFFVGHTESTLIESRFLEYQAPAVFRRVK